MSTESKTYRQHMLRIMQLMFRCQVFHVDPESAFIVLPGQEVEDAQTLHSKDEARWREMYETTYRDLWDAFLQEAREVTAIICPVRLERELVSKYGWKRQEDRKIPGIVSYSPPEHLRWQEPIKVDFNAYPENGDDVYFPLVLAARHIYQGALYGLSGSCRRLYEELELEDPDMCEPLYPRLFHSNNVIGLQGRH